MRHLSDEELQQVLDGGDVRTEHVAACAACREEIEALRAVLDEVKGATVPEPSPLFWDHFTERVGQAAREDSGEPRVAAPNPWRAWAWRAVALTAVAGAVVLAVVTSTDREAPRATAARLAPVSDAATTAPLAVAALDDDASWDAVSDVVSQADSSGDSFSLPAPGGAERDVVHMTDDERVELARLLEQELSRQGAHGRG